MVPLPYGRQHIEDDDIEAVVAVLKSDFLTTGPAVSAFEEHLSQITGAEHAIACATGTAALHLAVLGLGIGEGDNCIVPAITFPATANVCRLVGAEVTISDVDPDSGLMTSQNFEDAMSRSNGRARVVLPVHLAGQCIDMATVSSLARSADMFIVEDACHALGGQQAEPSGSRHAVGSCAFSDAAAFSFHPVKTVAMGEGGAITTNDAAVAERARTLRNHGITRDPNRFMQPDLAFDSDDQANPWYYEMQEIGFNYRASDIHCALGLSQLRKLARFVKHRAALVAAYDEALGSLSDRLRPLTRSFPDIENGWHLYVVLIDFEKTGRSRADVMRVLAAQGIGSQVHYLPLHWQPYYRQRYGQQRLPGADAYYERCLSLPLHVRMDLSDVLRIVDALASVLA